MIFERRINSQVKTIQKFFLLTMNDCKVSNRIVSIVACYFYVF